MTAQEDYLARYGADAIRRGSQEIALSLRRISTGSRALDRALGGGFPFDRPSLIWGQTESFKSLLLVRIAAHAQCLCRRCTNHKSECSCADAFTPIRVGLIDADGRFDPVHARKLAVDPDAILVTQPANGEQAIDAIAALSESCDLVLFDSLAGVVPETTAKSERAQEIAYERLVSACIRASVRKTVIFTNRSRLIGSGSLGHFELLPGGHLQTAACSISVKLWRGSWTSEGERPASLDLMFHVERNLTFAPRHGKMKLYLLEGGSRSYGDFHNDEELLGEEDFAK